jgi:hypothetical protein
MEVIDGEKIVTNASGAKLVLRGGSWIPYVPKTAGGDSSFWQRDILPLREPVAKALAYWPPGTPEIVKKMGTPEAAKDMASQIVPDTATDAALNVGMMALPEGEALEALPGPVRMLLKSKLGRIGAMTGLGAGAGALTGEGATTGAAKGALGQTGGEILSAGARRVLDGNEAARYASNLGASIKKNFPYLANSLEKIGNKLQTPADFDKAFKSGAAMNDMNRLLGETKDQVEAAVGKGPIFGVVLNPSSPQVQILPRSKAFQDLVRDNMREAQELGIKFDPKAGFTPTFRQADQLISRANQKAFSLSSGVGKDSAVAARIRRNADSALDDLRSNLNIAAPGIGDLYRDTQGKWAEANNVAKMFSEPKVIPESGKLDAGELQNQAKETSRAGYRRELESSPGGKQLLKDIFRGAPATATDRPRGGVSIGGEVWPLPIRIHSHVNPFGTTRAGKEAVSLYHGIPAIVAKALAERTGAFGDAE